MIFSRDNVEYIELRMTQVIIKVCNWRKKN